MKKFMLILVLGSLILSCGQMQFIKETVIVNNSSKNIEYEVVTAWSFIEKNSNNIPIYIRNPTYTIFGTIKAGETFVIEDLATVNAGGREFSLQLENGHNKIHFDGGGGDDMTEDEIMTLTIDEEFADKMETLKSNDKVNGSFWVSSTYYSEKIFPLWDFHPDNYWKDVFYDYVKDKPKPADYMLYVIKDFAPYYLNREDYSLVKLE